MQEIHDLRVQSHMQDIHDLRDKTHARPLLSAVISYTQDTLDPRKNT